MEQLVKKLKKKKKPKMNFIFAYDTTLRLLVVVSLTGRPIFQSMAVPIKRASEVTNDRCD